MKTSILATCAIALSARSAWAGPLTRRNTTEPCAAISSQFAQAVKMNSSAILFDPQTAQDCLLSIPFDSERSVSLVTEITKHIQFQSTLETLKNPPSSYLSKGVDILGGLSGISEKASQNGYASQYEFDNAITDLLSSANEGHLSIGLCTGSIFGFSIPFSIYSVSNDGIEPPELVNGRDLSTSAASNGSTSISAITTINGQNASDFLETFSASFSSQDPDARYNSLFYSYGRPSPFQLSGQFVNLLRWPGFSSVNIQFENGTSVDIPIRSSLYTITPDTSFNFTNGAQVFEYYCLPATTTSGSTEATPAANSTGPSTPVLAATETAGPLGYPTPVIRSDYNLIAGYDLEEQYNDTVVLFIPNFGTSGQSPRGDGELPEGEIKAFAEVAATFVENAKAQGKKRIIIDVTGNPGGTTISGFNLFKLFYPEPPIYMQNRYRDHTTERLMLKSLSDAGADFNETELFVGSVPRHWSWQGQVAPDGNETDFTSWEDWYGPNALSDGSSVTAPTNFNNFTAITSAEFPIQGYGEQTTNFTTAPFEGSDIIIMGDGVCASTCPIFVNLMKRYGSADIRTVVFGGRPNGQAMQIMGGTRGSELYTYPQLAEDAETILGYAVNRTLIANKPVLTDDEITEFNQSRPHYPSEFPLVVTSTSGVNLRNNYNEDDPELALQFAYEAADCRLYYSVENVIDPSTQWYSAAEAIWGGKGCVATASSAHDEPNGSGSGSETGSGNGAEPSSTGNPNYTGAAVSLGVSKSNTIMGLALLILSVAFAL